MLTFIRLSKQWYWEANRKTGVQDSILFHREGTEDEGCIWEVEFVERDLGQGGTATRLQIFDDTFKLFLLDTEATAIVAQSEWIITLDALGERLKTLGVKEIIQTEP